MSDLHTKKATTKRAQALREESKLAMREKISFTKTLNAIGDVEDKLKEMALGDAEPSNGRVGALRTLLDSKWKRMDRILPPMKAVEITGDDGGPINHSVKVAFVDSDS